MDRGRVLWPPHAANPRTSAAGRQSGRLSENPAELITRQAPPVPTPIYLRHSRTHRSSLRLLSSRFNTLIWLRAALPSYWCCRRSDPSWGRDKALVKRAITQRHVASCLPKFQATVVNLKAEQTGWNYCILLTCFISPPEPLVLQVLWICACIF